MKIKLNYFAESGGKPLRFSQNHLRKYSPKLLGGVAAFNLLLILAYTAFGVYTRYNSPPQPYRPYVVNPAQVAGWLRHQQNLLLVEIWEDEQAPAPLLRPAIRTAPLPPAAWAEEFTQLPARTAARAAALAMNLAQAGNFLQNLPQPRPGLIFYTLGPVRRQVGNFMEQLHVMGAEHIYALAGEPGAWAAAGLGRHETDPCPQAQ
jgi:hypothetical protein